MLRRFAPLLLVIGMTPVLMGAGGFNPPSSPLSIVGQQFTAIIQLDPHMAAGDAFGQVSDDVTTTAKRASIRLVGPVDKRKDVPLVSQAEFTALPDFALFRGCDLGAVPGTGIPRTELRFRFTQTNPTTLRAWVPEASLQFLFRPHGVTISDTNIPAILAINSVECVADPRNPGPLPDGGDGQVSEPDILLMHVTIGFVSP